MISCIETENLTFQNINDFNLDFTLLNLEHLKYRFDLKKLELYGDTLFVTSQQDDWYLRYNEHSQKVLLWHRNTRNNTKSFHKERMYFNNVIQVLGYIHHHDKKIFSLGHSGTYKKTKIELLFDKIEKGQSV